MSTLRHLVLPSLMALCAGACVPACGADGTAAADVPAATATAAADVPAATAVATDAAPAATAATAAAAAPDPARLAKAKVLAEVMHLDAQVRAEAFAAFDASLDTARSHIDTMPTRVQQAFANALGEVRQLMTKNIGWQGIIDEVTAAYARAYSADELDQLITLYRSPLGQRMLAESGGLSQTLTAASAARTDALMPAMQEVVDQRMQAAMDSVMADEHAQVGIIVGKPFPPITGTTLDGKVFDLGAWKGKVVLVDFWATWCRPCVHQMPGILAAYQKYHAQGFEIIGVSLDQDPEALTSFIKDEKIPWPQICDGQGWDTPMAVNHGIHSIPAPFLLAQDGTLIAADLGGQDLDDAIAKALATGGGKPAAATSAATTPTSP